MRAPSTDGNPPSTTLDIDNGQLHTHAIRRHAWTSNSYSCPSPTMQPKIQLTRMGKIIFSWHTISSAAVSQHPSGIVRRQIRARYPVGSPCRLLLVSCWPACLLVILALPTLERFPVFFLELVRSRRSLVLLSAKSSVWLLNPLVASHSCVRKEDTVWVIFLFDSIQPVIVDAIEVVFPVRIERVSL